MIFLYHGHSIVIDTIDNKEKSQNQRERERERKKRNSERERKSGKLRDESCKSRECYEAYQNSKQKT